MAGPNLELVKFAFYLFFPVGMFLHYGNPVWYENHVLPYKDKIFPPEKKLNTNLPTDSTTLKEELAKIKARRLERRAEMQRQEAQAAEQAAKQRLV